MNPDPQTAHIDRLLNDPAAGILPERMRTREFVEPRWNLPWQGNAEFITDIEIEEVPQTQRPAVPTEKFPAGESIANSFMTGLNKNKYILEKLKNLFSPGQL